MLKIGITGGIGSGKTTVAKIFEQLQVPVYYADAEAKKLMNSSPLREKIMAIFGEESYLENGTLNRTFLAEKVFTDKTKISQLNKLVHPATIAHAKNWMLNQNTPYALKEAAIIFESGSGGDLDYIIGVYAPLHIRMQRVMQRDGISREEVQKRMQNQISEEIKMKLCDFVIYNNNQQLVIPQVLQLHQQLLQLSAENK